MSPVVSYDAVYEVGPDGDKCLVLLVHTHLWEDWGKSGDCFTASLGMQLTIPKSHFCLLHDFGCFVDFGSRLRVVLKLEGKERELSLLWGSV